ncbi:MAG TPA: hypothetical protein PK674_02845 [Candidatus Absconditabacterales bacterium]|nr:hypothetical protein [Candidatus Absconditabacterales bacterium]HOQ79150.1 hypothetical protein [Candidatus Absconditabacterales bacterium]HPK28239.1 hypothetical protein [Candidatus Absconditabacterales bacterium]
MKIVSKIITWILSIIFLFIIINLAIGVVKYEGLANYSDFLNQKERNTVVSQISIKDPISIFSLFYGEYTPREKNIDVRQENLEDKIIDQELQKDSQVDEEAKLNVYDPDFEDDFNAFFGKTHISKKKSDLINEEGGAFVVPETSEQDNLNQTNSKQDNANTKTVGQQLLEKFSK